MSTWQENKGKMPRGASGKRVAVKLRNGMVEGEKPVSPVTPAGWPADGKTGCRWTLTGDAFDILEWRFVS